MKALRTDRSGWMLVLIVSLLSTGIVYRPVFVGRVPFPSTFIFSFPLYEPIAPAHFVRNVADVGDLITQFYPYRTIGARAISEGALAKWNPYMFAGTTFVGNPLSALFYPPNALYYILPVAAAWTIGFLVRTFLCLGFTALFLRRIGATSTGALVAALLFTFSGFMTVWQGQTMTDTAIWLPLICYSVVRLHDERSRASVMLTAFAFAMPALSGHPETMAHMTLLGSFLAVYLSILRPSSLPKRRTGQFLSCFAAAGLLSMGIAAIQLIPAVDWFNNVYLGLSNLWPPAPLWSLLGFASRDVMGSVNSFGLVIPNQAAYVGMMAFLAAPIGLLSKSRRYVVFFLIVGTLAICTTYNIAHVLDVVQHIPLLKTMKHDRLILVGTFAISVLAGFGISVVEDLRNSFITDRALRASAYAALGFCTAALLIYGGRMFTSTVPEDPLRYPKATLLFLALNVVVVIAGLFLARRYDWFRFAVLFVVACDVCSFAYGFLPFERPRNIFPPNPLFTRLSELEKSPFRMTSLGGPFPTNTQLMYGLYESGGYEIPVARLKKFSEGIAFEGTDSVVFDTNRILETKDRRVDLLNTKYYVISKFERQYSRFKETPDRFRFLYEYGDTGVFENLKALPAAFLVPATGIRVMDNEAEQMKTLKDPSFDPEKSVILPEPLTPESSTRAPSQSPAGVSWVRKGINDLEIRVTASQSSILVLSQTYYPGWKAWVDGKRVRILPADFALTAIAVGPGASDVRFSYEPATLRIGIAVTLLILLVIAAILAKTPLTRLVSSTIDRLDFRH